MRLLILEMLSEASKEKNYAAYYWAGYFRKRYYNSQEELLSALDEKINHINRTSVIGPKTTRESILQYLDVVQLKSGKWTAKMKRKFVFNEKKTLIDNWDEFEIIHTSYRQLDTIGNSNFNDYDIKTSPQIFKISDFLHPDDKSYANEQDRIKRLAETIMANKQFEPIVVEPNQEWVIEGQHRIRALNLLGFKTVLAYQIIDLDEI